MSILVLVTRPIEQARAFAAEIEAMGGEPVFAPLLDICFHSIDFASVPVPDAILLTSAQAVARCHFPENWSHIPVYCVGAVTEEAARRAGAVHCITGQGGVDEVLAMIRRDAHGLSKVLYLCGEHTTRDVVAALPDQVVTVVESYAADAVVRLPDVVMSRFSEISVVTVFSTRTAQILRDVMERAGLVPYAKNINLLCLSSSVLESLDGMGWASCHVAAHPTQSDMIDMIKRLIQE